MLTTTVHGVSVKYRTVDRSRCGLFEVEYTGVLGDSAVPHLWADLVVRTANVPALILRVHRALTVYRGFPEVPLWVGRVCPGAIIVREDQHAIFSEMARSLVGRGVVRGVFLQTHEHLAFEWAEEEARSQLAGLSPLRQRTPGDAPAHLESYLAK